VIKSAAPDVAEAVEAELLRQISAGTDPEGKAWKPREAGGKALATAGKALVVVPMGTRIFARLSGHVARHHLGIGKGGVQRQILPGRKLPPQIAEAVSATLLSHAADHMKAGA
jgi:hypothetical protein